MPVRYKALLLGVHEQAADPETLPTLHGPPHDLLALRGALSNRDTGLIAGDDITSLRNPTKAQAEQAIHKFFSTGQRDDVLLFYFSGHGRLTRENKLFLCASDTVTARLPISGIAATTVRDCMEASDAQTLVVILDCCHSGAFRGGTLPSDVLGGRGTFLLSSARAHQLADDGDGRGPSPFTAAIVHALQDAASDIDGDGLITFDDVYRVAYARLAPLKQFPQRSMGEGTIALALSPDGARASKPPATAELVKLHVQPGAQLWPGPSPDAVQPRLFDDPGKATPMWIEHREPGPGLFGLGRSSKPAGDAAIEQRVPKDSKTSSLARDVASGLAIVALILSGFLAVKFLVLDSDRPTESGLSPAPGPPPSSIATIHLTMTPGISAELFIDDKKVATVVDRLEIPVTAGQRKVKLVGPGGTGCEQVMALAAGKTTQLECAMSAAPGSGAGSGSSMPSSAPLAGERAGSGSAAGAAIASHKPSDALTGDPPVPDGPDKSAKMPPEDRAKPSSNAEDRAKAKVIDGVTKTKPDKPKPPKPRAVADDVLDSGRF